MTKNYRIILLALAALAVFSCRREDPAVNPPAPQPAAQTEWLSREDGFQDRYLLDQMVVLSRHNIRSPLVGPGSILTEVTNPAFQWFNWEGEASHLTAKGERLETKMGAFFRQWLGNKGFLDSYARDPYAFRLYANGKQRCQLTARRFADALLPGDNPKVEMNIQYDKMDPVFNPQITKLSAEIEARAQQEILQFGDLNAAAAEGFALIERVVDITNAPCYPGFQHFGDEASSVSFSLNAEPSMSGGLKKACSVSDALVLQYYEEPDEKKAAFGQTLTLDDWVKIGQVKDWYGDVLFTAPSVSVNVAHPLLQTMLSELQNSRRTFTFLCGHDSNLGSVLAALQAQDYDLPQAIEKKTPIGSKLVVEKFLGKDGYYYADLWLVYASTKQLREETSLSYNEPPVAVRIGLKGLRSNVDGLYLLQDVYGRFSEAIDAYYEL